MAFCRVFSYATKTICNEIYSTNIDNLILVKERWLVSIAMILLRIKKIELISQHQFIRAYQKLVSQFGKKIEPLDDVIQHEKSNLFNRITELLNDKAISQKTDTYFYLGLPEDFMMQVLEIKKPDLPLTDNVIKLKFS